MSKRATITDNLGNVWEFVGFFDHELQEPLTVPPDQRDDIPVNAMVATRDLNATDQLKSGTTEDSPND